MVAGAADGWLYAVDARTGEPVWKFHLSERSVNSPPLFKGHVVYAAHSEENVDSPGLMGRVVAIDARGRGDITTTGEIWRADGIAVGFAAPTVAEGRVHVVDNAATCTPSRRRPASRVDLQPRDDRARRPDLGRRQALRDRADRPRLRLARGARRGEGARRRGAHDAGRPLRRDLGLRGDRVRSPVPRGRGRALLEQHQLNQVTRHRSSRARPRPRGTGDRTRSPRSPRSRRSGLPAS